MRECVHAVVDAANTNVGGNAAGGSTDDSSPPPPALESLYMAGDEVGASERLTRARTAATYNAMLSPLPPSCLPPFRCPYPPSLYLLVPTLSSAASSTRVPRLCASHSSKAHATPPSMRPPSANSLRTPPPLSAARPGEEGGREREKRVLSLPLDPHFLSTLSWAAFVDPSPYACRRVPGAARRPPATGAPPTPSSSWSTAHPLAAGRYLGYHVSTSSPLAPPPPIPTERRRPSTGSPSSCTGQRGRGSRDRFACSQRRGSRRGR